MTLRAIVALLPGLTIAERSALRDAVERSLAGVDPTPVVGSTPAPENGAVRPRRRVRLTQQETDARLRLARDFGDLDGILEVTDRLPPSFEDTVLVASAAAAGLDLIVTRDLTDFSGAPLPVHTPGAFIARKFS